MSNSQPESSEIIASPPALYLGAFLTGCIIQLVSQLPVLSSISFRLAIGLFFLVISGAFARWAFVKMRQIGTTASPYESSTSLITTGPFQYSRNPIYVAMTGLYIGGAILINSGWPLLLLVPLLLLMHYGVILREERYLGYVFGEEYAAYKSAVKRWL
ncbi:methyltransferase family protein [Kaarinaea lacus]